jgi:hypothetical protein
MYTQVALLVEVSPSNKRSQGQRVDARLSGSSKGGSDSNLEETNQGADVEGAGSGASDTPIADELVGASPGP